VNRRHRRRTSPHGVVLPLEDSHLPSSHVLVRGTLLTVPLRSRGFRREAPSEAMASAPPTGLDPLQGMTRRPLPVPPGTDGLPEVPVPYSGRDSSESASPGVSTPRHVPPSTFHTSSTVFSSNGLPALFRPVPLLGFTLQSFAPPRKAVHLSVPVLSCRFQQPRSSTLRFSGRSRFSAASESCSFRGVRTPRDRRPAAGRCSPGFGPLQGARRLAMANASAGLPPRTSSLDGLRRGLPGPCLGVSLDVAVRSSVTREPTLLRFLT